MPMEVVRACTDPPGKANFSSWCKQIMTGLFDKPAAGLEILVKVHVHHRWREAMRDTAGVVFNKSDLAATKKVGKNKIQHV